MIYIYSMILVTGGTGLAGSHLLYVLLEKGLPVRALHRKESNREEVKKILAYYSDKAEDLFSKIEWAEGDLLDTHSLEEAMNNVSDVYHCAAIVSMDADEGERMIHNNVTGTANMVNAALEKKIRKFCYVSSVAALGIESGKEITEETPWNDQTGFSAYAISKYLSENEVWRASQEGLDVVIVNPTIVIGPGNWNRSSGQIFRAAHKGLRWYSTGSMGYVDVRDVAKAMMRLMESDVVNQKFIVSAENRSFRDFFNLVYASLGKPTPNKRAGKLLLEIGWRADKFRSILTGSQHILTKEVARYATTQLSYSGAKIEKTTGMNFIPIEEAITHAAQHYLSDLNGPKK